MAKLLAAGKGNADMIWNVDAGWLFMAVATVGGISYMLALLLESSIGREGFGPFGNAALITAGFFLAIYAANHQGIRIGELKHALMIGLGGSFLLLLFVLAVRGVWARL
ncbi:MAG: hypothetical protein JJ913_05550 [Rhizobiaceae bacterium]|nr:hypothetical protein [Rhizobiaceae bacterium]